MSTTKAEVVEACAVKKFQQMIREYQGRPEGLRVYLLKRLGRMNKTADKVLASVIDETL